MIGLFIGSFNPPTKAHFEIAEKLKKRYQKILFVPVNSREKHLIDFNDRFYMLTIFTRKDSSFIVDDIMKNYSYLNYRVIDLLKKKYHKIELIIGSDILEKLVSFDNYKYLLENYSFVVISRDEIDTKKLIKEKYHDYIDKFTILNYHSDISSTKARKLLKEGRECIDILDKEVYEYIKNKHLYF